MWHEYFIITSHNYKPCRDSDIQKYNSQGGSLQMLATNFAEKRTHVESLGAFGDGPIDDGKVLKTLEWETIGNGRAVPSLLDRKPFLEHWALCVVTAEKFDPASRAGRQAFLEGSYFDMGVEASERGWFKASSNSDMHNLRNAPAWTLASVRKITCIEELGFTTNLDFILLSYTVGSPNCLSKIRLLLSMRSYWLRSVRSKWHESLMVASSIVAWIPVIGPIVVGHLANDGVKDGKIQDTWQQLASVFPKLEDVTPCHW
ncbi:hypothetical protein EV127DRAFT_407906 [Xylaria flabelliformis]|nr:hypothetical protein EV127DRAFT_407906 [Xylaria flabelliformis]